MHYIKIRRWKVELRTTHTRQEKNTDNENRVKSQRWKILHHVPDRDQRGAPVIGYPHTEGIGFVKQDAY